MDMEERESKEGGKDEGRKVTRSDRDGEVGENDEQRKGCC